MRFLLLGLAAACLALPASAPVKACEGYAAAAQATVTQLSADEAKDAKKPMKKTAAKKKAKPKVEYMRAAPMPPGAK